MRIFSIIKKWMGRSENPQTNWSDPDEWLVDGFGGRPTSSGVRINNSTSMEYSPVFRAVSLISRDVAKLPLVTYKRSGSGKDKDTKHPAFNLLRHKSNNGLTAINFKMNMMAHALLSGNAYAFIIRAFTGRPLELIPLDSTQTYPIRENGKLWYITSGANGELRRMTPRNIIHIRGAGDNPLMGDNLVQKARESMGYGKALGEYGSRFFSNNARPGMILEHPGTLSDQAVAHLRSSWTSGHGQLKNAHKPAILEEGMKATVFQNTNEDAQFLGSREFQIRDVANWFGIPPHKLGDTTRTSFSSLEQENQSYLDDALDPWLVNWESECREKLLTDDEKDNDTHVVEFLRQALIRTNLSDRGAFYASALASGWMSRDEVRSRENLNPIPGGEGEEFLMPLNMGKPGDTPPPPNPPPQEDKADKEALRGVLKDCLFRMTKRLTVHHGKGDLRQEHGVIVREALNAISLAMGINVDDVAEDLFQAFDNYDQGVAEDILSTLPNQIAKGY